MKYEIVWYIHVCFSPIPCAARDIPFQNCNIRQKFVCNLKQALEWPDHSDRGDSMTALVERTHTHTHMHSARAGKGHPYWHVCRIFVEIAIVT